MRYFIGVIAFVALLLAGCQQPGDQQQAASRVDNPPAPAEAKIGPTPASGQVEVQMKHNSFEPDRLRVRVGTTVSWKNMDANAHTVTSGERTRPSGVFDSGEIAPQASFSYTFDQTGTFPYFCDRHMGMDGTVVVEQ